MADGIDHTPFEPPTQPKHPPLSVTITPCPDHTVTDTDLLSPHAPLPPPTHNPHNLHSQQHGGLQNLDNYFVGPRDLSHHSKWPTFCRMHGSILPKMLLPLLFVGGWATAVTVISETLHPLGVNSVLLTITGFVVGLGLSFRSSTAYERYQEGRKYWTSLITASQTLGRVFWIHATDRADPDSLTDPRAAILARLGAMNLLLAFALSLKHALRFEPFTDYDDMRHLVAHLDTFARAATENPNDNNDDDNNNNNDNSSSSAVRPPKPGLFKSVGEYLGVSFATSNPRKPLKRAARPLGNLPLEILSHLASTVDQLVAHQQLPVPMQQTLAYSNLTVLGDVLAGCERVLNTPLPLAYSIAISQTTWVYVMLLPFQLVGLLGYVAIPATLAAAYIILGLLLIGRQIEDPFGHDVNDLPMDSFCDQIAAELDIIASFEKKPVDVMFAGKDSFPLFPVSSAPASVWMQRSEQKLRHAVRTKPNATFERRRERHASKMRRLPKRKADENV